MAATGYKEACEAVQQAGYATDPNYAKQLIKLIEQYKLYNYDKKEVQAINLDGYNYVKLRDLADNKMIVDYDAVNKLPIVKVK